MAEQETQRELKMVDIVDFSMQDKPIKVTDAFNTLIADKVTNSIDARTVSYTHLTLPTILLV